MEERKYEIRPVGYVRSERKKPQFGGWKDHESEIVVNSEYAEGLEGIEGYSHVNVIWWFHTVDKVKIKMHPQGKQDVPVVGIFACRCPSRPNPVGATTCEVIGREGNVLRLRGLDAIDGTPVIDIKPMWPQYDSVREYSVPEWVGKIDF